MTVSTTDRIPSPRPAGDATDAATRVVVVSAGFREASGTARLGDAVGRACVARLGEHGTPASLHHHEVRQTAADVTALLLGAEATPTLHEAIAATRRADALVIVTPTVNASFSGLLKSFLDVLPPDALRGVPTVIAATGGTQRHTLMLDQSLRPMLGYLRAMVLPTCLFVTADGWDGPRPSPELALRIDAAGHELAAFARVTQPARSEP